MDADINRRLGNARVWDDLYAHLSVGETCEWCGADLPVRNQGWCSPECHDADEGSA